MTTSSDKSGDSVILFYFISVFCAFYSFFFCWPSSSVLVSMSKNGNQTVAIETSIIPFYLCLSIWNLTSRWINAILMREWG